MRIAEALQDDLRGTTHCADRQAVNRRRDAAKHSPTAGHHRASSDGALDPSQLRPCREPTDRLHVCPHAAVNVCGRVSGTSDIIVDG